MVFLFCLLIMVSCGLPANTTPVAPPSDEEYAAAVEQAHETINILLQALLAPKPSYSYLGLRVRFRTADGGTNDDWAEPVDYYDGVFTIKMLDSLTYNSNLHVDHLLNVPLRKAVDWMIVEKDGNLIGGYTIRLLYEHLTPAEQEKFLKDTGYKIK